jgi:hypothetical protein
MERRRYEIAPQDDIPPFACCGLPSVGLEPHFHEVKALHTGFGLLASTPERRIKVLRHETRPLVGVLFHPEEYTDAFPDGRAILVCFFRDRSVGHVTMGRWRLKRATPPLPQLWGFRFDGCTCLPRLIRYRGFQFVAR